MATIITHEGESFQTWSIDEVYRGIAGTADDGLHLPNVGDLVFSADIGWYLVTYIDVSGTYPIPVLVRWTEPDTTQADNLNEGLSYRYARGSNKAFYDTTVTPYTIVLTAGSYIFNADASKAKLFKGVDTSDDGTVISEVYDSNSNYIGETFNLLELDSVNYPAIKVTPTIYTSASLESGESVTLVCYSAAGAKVYEETFIVRLSSAIKAVDTSNKYLTSISLVSDLLSETDNTIIENELNVEVSTALMSCRLHYTNGDTVDVGIDGNKAVLEGLDSFNVTLSNVENSLVLMYYPDAEEAAINLSNGVNPALTAPYTIKNVTLNNEYSFMLYCIPVYNDLSTGYSLKWYLCDSSWESDIDVTSYVTVTTTPGGTPWDHTGFEVNQELIAILNIDDVLVLGDMAGYVVAQKFNLYLEVPTAGTNNAWVIDYSTNGDLTLGNGVDAKFSNNNDIISIDGADTIFSVWLDKLYRQAAPIYDTDLMTQAPEPTHFYYLYDGKESVVHNIEDWNNDLPYIDAANISAYSTLEIRWVFRETPTSPDQVLGYTPLLLRSMD